AGEAEAESGRRGGSRRAGGERGSRGRGRTRGIGRSAGAAANAQEEREIRVTASRGVLEIPKRFSEAIDRSSHLDRAVFRRGPSQRLDGDALQVLVRAEEVFDLAQEVMGHVFELADVAEKRVLVRHGEQLEIVLPLVAHAKNADDAGLDEAAAEG